MNPVGNFFKDWATNYDSQLLKMASRDMVMVPTVSTLMGNLVTKPDQSPREQWIVQIILEIVHRFHNLGGKVALGNDFNDGFVKERMPLLEMEMLLEAGLTALEVIEAGTHYAAQVYGCDNELGTL